MLIRALFLSALCALPVAAGEGDLPPLAGDVVILGELHDNPAHHANQALAVAALRPAALVFEMLTPDQAGRVTPGLRSDARALEAALGWNASGWPDFAMYHPIFLAAPEAGVFGGALPRDEVRRAMGEGAAAVFGDGADAYGLAEALAPSDQAARETEQQDAHCGALPAAMLPGMVAAQRLRDAALARAVVRAHGETGGPVAVITGNGHARRDTGIPAVLARVAPGLSVVALGQFEAAPDGAVPYDHWLVAAPALRDDPCATLR